MTENSSFFSSDWLGAFLIIAILFGGFGNGFGGGRGPIPMPNYATAEDVTNAVNNQSVQSGIQNVLLSSANNNYETARLIDTQTANMTNQNNTNLLTAINGFNALSQSVNSNFANTNQNLANGVSGLRQDLFGQYALTNQNIAAGFSDVRQGMAALGAQMNECCCSIKTMMLENRLQDTQIALQNEQNKAVNAEQSQYLLSVMGNWVPKAATT